jgi:Cu/Ag efflux protein CusF
MKVESGMVFLRTAERTIRNLSITEAKRDGMSSLQPGDEVDLILDKGNSVVAVAPPRGTGAFIGDGVTGTVQRFDRLNKRITLKTEEGEIQNFELRGALAEKLNGIKKGRTISLEMDGQHRAFDAYRAE